MKIIFSCLLVLSLLASLSLAATPEKKEFRLGLRGGFVNPVSNGAWLNANVLSTVLELDVKRNSRIDAGLRLGYDAFSVNTPAYIANYDLYQVGLGARYYFIERKSPETAFHTLKPYAMIDGNLMLASKYRDITLNSPPTFYGLGVKVGAGLEYVFGPLSSGFVDIEYTMSSLTSSDGANTLSASGFLTAFGVRLAI